MCVHFYRYWFVRYESPICRHGIASLQSLYMRMWIWIKHSDKNTRLLSFQGQIFLSMRCMRPCADVSRTAQVMLCLSLEFHVGIFVSTTTIYTYFWHWVQWQQRKFTSAHAQCIRNTIRLKSWFKQIPNWHEWAYKEKFCQKL